LLVIIAPFVLRRLRRGRQGFKARDVIDAVSILDRSLHALRAIPGDARNTRRGYC
jgi:hypothetical protein